MTKASDRPPPSKQQRRILLVSYWYPPAVGAAAERLQGFARYLPDHGWDVHVLTAERASSPDLSGVTVHRVRDPYGGSGQAFFDYDPRKRPSRLKSFFREFVFPDRFLKWQQAAYRPAIDIIRATRFDAILASFPPASAVQLALRLHRETEIPLVIDFRDRWIGPGGYEPRREKMLQAHRELECQAVTEANGIIAVSDAMADAIANEQKIDPKKILVLPNGYDPDAPQPRPPKRRDSMDDSKFTIAHVGTVIPRNRPDLFFDSLLALKDDPRLANVLFKFVGNLSQSYLNDAGLASLVTTTGLIPRDQAREEMRTAHALLLLTGAYVGRWGHNAKIFEYLQSARPILCLEESPDSNDRRLLERLAPDRDFFALVDDANAIADRIERIKSIKPDLTQPMDDAFRAYGRDKLAARLAAYLPT